MKKFLCLALILALASYVWADAPANDNLADAQAYTVGTQVTGTTVEATLEEGEADSIGEGWVNSVWYKFNLGTAFQQKVTITVKATEGSAQDTALVVATGTGFADFTYLTRQDTTVDETYAGTFDGDKDYYVGVYGWNADSCGEFTLESTSVPIKSWYCSPDGAGSGDSFEDPCDVKTAFANVAAGNAVYMAPGTYVLSEVGEAGNVRWTDGTFLLLQTAGVSVIGAGSDQTIILCDQTNDVGVAILAKDVTFKGVQIQHPMDIKGNDSWGGAFYGLTAALTTVDAGGLNLEDVYVYVGAEGGETNVDSGRLIRPACIQTTCGTTMNIKDCAFISYGLLTSCQIKPFTWDAAADGDKTVTYNFDCCTFRSNKDVIQEQRPDNIDHNSAIFGNVWYSNVDTVCNVRNCVFLNTKYPVGEQANDDERAWTFNVKDCFMPEADLERQTRATANYINCDTVMDPQVDGTTWTTSLVKAGKGCVIPFDEYVVVVDEDFSSYDEGSLIGHYGWSNGYGNDGSGTVVKDGENTYVTLTSGSGLWGAHYTFDNPVETGWLGGSLNPYRLWVYSARLKYSGSTANPWFGLWDPQLYESQFKRDGDHYLFSPDGATWSSLEIPVDEWFDFEIAVDPTAVNKHHNTLYVTINGVTEELNVAGGQENDSDIFKTFRYFFWGGGLSVSIDSFKLVYMCDGPANDYLARAKEYTPGTTVIGNNEYARVESGESTDELYSIWYTFKAEDNMGLEVTTAGTWDEFANDTMMGVFSAETATPTFEDLTEVVPLTDTGRDETFKFAKEAGKYYFIVIGSYEGAGNVKLSSEDIYIGNLYVAPGATGSGQSEDDPMGSVSEAMDAIAPGYTVKLAPGEYSIADNFNQIDAWGAGMTILCYKAVNVTLQGAGPDKTKIVAPEGYVGVRMERDGATLRDLTIEAHGETHFVNHYNWHMNGALCACNCSGMVVSNVAIVSEAGTDGGALRPFPTYSVTDFTVTRVAVDAPNCGCPVFFDKVKDVTVSYLTVNAKNVANNPAIYCGNWPWGVNEGLTFNNVLLANAYMPFTVEIDEEVFIYNSIYYNCPNDSNFNEDADVVEEGCVSYEEGDHDPGFETLEGFVLTSTSPTYKNVGWRTICGPENDNLADAIDVGEGATVGDNTRATVEEGENEAHKASVWYTFTPSEDGTFRISDEGSHAVSGYDAMLSIYTVNGEEVSFATLEAVVETQDTGTDETYDLKATAGTTYYICWDGYEGSQGEFTMTITKLHDGPWYVAPGATGTGTSPDDPTGDLIFAMENVVPGQTVNLAAGEYSIAEFYNQTDIWGAGMTALCFKATDVTLKGAGPDKTIFTVPAGYVGIRMERNGASVQDLTIKAYRPETMPYHYNWHMQGALCACNCSGMSVKNVAIYSEQKTGEIRPFAVYSVTDFTVDRLGVEAPYCASPCFFDKVKDVTVNNLTVSGCNEDQNPAVYCGNWPWGVNEGLTFRNVLLCNTFYPFTVEIDEEVFIYDSVYYNCAEESNFNEDADVVEENCTYYAEGENSPELAEVDGFILTAVNPFYKNIGWHTYIEEFAAATLGYNLRGTGSIAVDGNDGFEEVWKSEYFKDMYICGSAVEYEGYLYLSNDPSPDATVLKINVETGEVEEFYTEPSWDNGAPTITDAGYLYVCDEKANLCKVDLETKETVWVCQLAESGDRLTSSAIKFNGGKAYVKVAGKGLFAVTASGSVAWCYEDADCADGWAGNGVSFNADGTQVYYKDAGAVIAVNTADGTLAWTGDTDEADTDDNMSCREPIVGADGTVFAIARPGDDNAVIYAFNSDGSKKWATTLSARCGDDGGLALNLGEDIVFASYQEGVAALSTETGEIIWEAPIGHVRNSVVPINEGGLYAVTEGDDGSFLVFLTDGTDGVEPTVVWSYEIADTNTSNHMRPVVLENGDVFCGTPYTIACVRPVVPEPAIFGLLALVALFLRRK